MSVKPRKEHMQDGTFAELMESAEQALAYECGAREGYRVVQVDGPMLPQRDPTSETVPPKGKPRFRRSHKNTSYR